ncbi:MAG: hypothetical protein ACLQVL_33000 [Terriglobia bacterium]
MCSYRRVYLSAGAGPASAPGGARVALPPMRQVSLADGTGTVSLPAGWNLDPKQSGMGMASVKGPQGEWLALNTYFQDNNMYGNGMIGHGTLWNSEADALVKADPNRFEYVPTQNYWRGTDYAP